MTQVINWGVGAKLVPTYTVNYDATMTTKETVRALLDRLPDDCTLDDVQYHLYVTQAVARGVEDERAGRTISQADVESEMRRKWLVGNSR